MRVATPTVLQMEAVECGAASLAMILGYFGTYVPLEQLRVECGVSRDGSKASNILKAARRYGLEAAGYKKEVENLGDLPLPQILYWNFNHFVVLEGIKGRRVYLNDPAMGPRIVTLDELDASFTGLTLSFAKGPGYVPSGHKPDVCKSLAARLSGYRAALGCILLAGLFLVVPGIVIPGFSQIFVDEILVKGLSDWLRPLVAAMLATAVLRGALTWLQQYLLLRMNLKLSLTASSAYFLHVFRLPAQFFLQRFAGEIAYRVDLNDKLAGLLSGQLGTNLIQLVSLAFFAAVMFQYDLTLTLVTLGVAACNVAALRFVSRKRNDLNQRFQQEYGKLVGVTMGGLQLIESLKAGGGESDFFATWAGQQAKVVDSQQSLSVWTQMLGVVPPLLAAVNTAVILGLGALRVMDGAMTIGMLAAFQSLAASFMNPVNQLVNLGGAIQEAQADVNRLDDVMRHPVDTMFTNPAQADPPAPDAPIRLEGRLELVDVTFGYSPLDPPLLENFSLTLPPKSRVALVGGSGSGKSTVAKLVTGLYKPWSGQILYDGKPIEEIPNLVLQNSLAMVNQDIFLFEGTVRDNLTLWDDTIPEADVIAAAKDARIHDDVASRGGGYVSRVEEGGRNFSGGQRQRLEIARALAKNPAILVMDEATSALDAETEKFVDDSIRRRGVTCLIIAHRLSTIRDADEIIVLDQGKVAQRGPHDQLMAQGGAYAELVRSV